MPGADGMSTKFMKSAFVGWTFTAGLYYPPDFDSTKLTPLKKLRPKGQQQAYNMRMMFPFTMICDGCGEYNYPGTKFTARVEDIKHETYLGIKVYRFYGRCKHCFAEFTFKTDPKNSDYTMESGGKRTYEAWKDADMVESQLKAEKEREAELDQMKALEQKSVDVQAEIERIEDLDAIRTMNRRLGARDKTIEEALEHLFQKVSQGKSEEKSLSAAETVELNVFREAQDGQRRKELDDEVEGVAQENKSDAGSIFETSTTASGRSSSSSSSTLSSEGEVACAIAAAVSERAKEQEAAAKRKGAVGALLAARKKPVGTTSADSSPLAKRPKNEEGSGAPEASASPGTSSPATACNSEKADSDKTGGLMGLGGYDSDSS